MADSLTYISLFYDKLELMIFNYFLINQKSIISESTTYENKGQQLINHFQAILNYIFMNKTLLFEAINCIASTIQSTVLKKILIPFLTLVSISTFSQTHTNQKGVKNQCYL